MKNPFVVLLQYLKERFYPLPSPLYDHVYGTQYILSKKQSQRVASENIFEEFDTGYLFRIDTQTGIWEVRRLDTGWRIADPWECIYLESAYIKKIPAALYYETPPQ